MVEYFYHLKPNKLKGKILYSLSELEEKAPELAKEYSKAYKDRESLLNKKVPPLDCKWKDVIFLSYINPTLVFTALDLLGLLDKDIPIILKFPISALKNKNFCFYQEEDKNIFKNMSVESYKELKELPTKTITYFVNCIKKNESPLIFSGIPHLLLNDNLDINKAEEVKYTSIHEK